jgi:hypothetical protein
VMALVVIISADLTRGSLEVWQSLSRPAVYPLPAYALVCVAFAIHGTDPRGFEDLLFASLGRVLRTRS